MSIRLTDNSPVPEKYRDRCGAIQDLVKGGRCSLIDLLDKAGKKARDIPQIFKNANGELWAGNLVGVFEYRAGDGSAEQVVIGDRFGPGQVANGGANGEFLSPFVWAMLEECWDDTPLWLLEESRARGQIDILDHILMVRLAAQLERAWKKGRFRVYRTFSCYDSRVRGQLDLPRKIRMSMGLDDGKMACRVREYSEDNLYNQLFFQACLEAERRQPKLMRRLRQTMPGCHMARQALERQNTGWGRPDTRSLLNGTRKKITNPVYRDYETLRGAARAVLKRSSHSSHPYAESGAPFVTGIFLDVSKLWEDYLYKAVFPELSARPVAQEYIPILDKSLYVEPDFLWEGEKRLVLDAKYRPAWGRVLKKVLVKAEPDNKDRKKIQDDVYQVLSYMLALDCTHGGVIFPVKNRNNSKYSAKRLQAVNDKAGRNFWLIPFVVPLIVPQCEDKYFSEAMRKEADRVRGEVEKFLKNGPGPNP